MWIHFHLPRLLITALLLGACALAPTTRTARPHLSPDAVLLHVQNEHWEDAAVYLVRAGVPLKLGTVGGLGARTFRVRSSLLGTGQSLALKAELRTSRQAHTSMIFDAPSTQQLNWIIPFGLRASAVSIR